jgi:hypothetical protein
MRHHDAIGAEVEHMQDVISTAARHANQGRDVGCRRGAQHMLECLQPRPAMLGVDDDEVEAGPAGDFHRCW